MGFWIFAETLGIYYIPWTKSFSGTGAVGFFQRKYLSVLAGVQHGYKAGMWFSVVLNSEPEFFLVIKKMFIFMKFITIAKWQQATLALFWVWKCSRSAEGAWEFVPNPGLAASLVVLFLITVGGAGHWAVSALSSLLLVCSLRILVAPALRGVWPPMVLENRFSSGPCFIRLGKQLLAFRFLKRLHFQPKKFKLNYKENLCACALWHCPKTGSCSFRSCLWCQL